MAAKSAGKTKAKSQAEDESIGQGAQAIRLPNGAVVYVHAAPGFKRSAIAPSDFRVVCDTIEGVSNAVVAVWEKIRPSKASVEFGLALEGGSGQLISLFAGGKAKAHLTVTLEWEAAKAGEKKSTPRLKEAIEHGCTCRVCGKSFENRENCETHVEKNHPAFGPAACLCW